MPGLAGGRVPGHRHTSTKEKTSQNHGGRREKKQFNLAEMDNQIHTDLRELINESGGFQPFLRHRMIVMGTSKRAMVVKVSEVHGVTQNGD